jgi:hypothetical protein
VTLGGASPLFFGPTPAYVDGSMRIRRSLAVAVSVCATSVVIAVCARGDATDRIEEKPTTAAADAAAPPAAAVVDISPEQILQATSQVQFLADSIDKRLRKVPALSMREKMRLRADANAEQIARARQMGVNRTVKLEQAIADEKLVQLGDTTELWALHNLNFSVPYVTPSAEAMITEIAQRFQQKLDSLGVPRYRIVITSAMRTSEKQAALRRVNSNASRVESAHEFGTTVDIAYRRFAAPLDAAPLPADTIKRLADSVLVRTANLRSAELQAVLGRVMRDMQQEGKLLVMMERRQTVYHITVARKLTRPAPLASPAVAQAASAPSPRSQP